MPGRHSRCPWADVWEELISPVWPQLLRILRADIAVRVRRSGEDGLGMTAATLHATVDWSNEAVRVQMLHHEELVECGGTGLVLMPSMMMSPKGCAVITERPAHPTIFYPTRGVSAGWHRAGEERLEALTALLGQARARLVLELQQPLSTTECAALTGIAISTAYHHLRILEASGLIDSRRDGVRVLHVRTPLGEALAGST
jgi:DNA-binding transcriptional ArsR family regulator